jgi:IS5 family transposase
LESQLSSIHAKKQVEAAWPPLLVFKALLLQSWYGLIDPGLEKQLARDLMFRRFINLEPSEGVPDHGTVWRFRNQLTRQLLDALLAEVNRQLSAKGLYIKAGEVSIVDATVIEAKQSHPRKARMAGIAKTVKPVTTSRLPPMARRPALMGIRRMSTSMRMASSKSWSARPPTNTIPMPLKNC